MELTLRTPYKTYFENFDGFSRVIAKTNEAALVIQNKSPASLYVLPPGYNIFNKQFEGQTHLGIKGYYRRSVAFGRLVRRSRVSYNYIATIPVKLTCLTPSRKMRSNQTNSIKPIFLKKETTQPANTQPNLGNKLPKYSPKKPYDK